MALGDCLPGDVVPDEALLQKCLDKARAWYPSRDDVWTGLRRHRTQIPTAWMFTCLKRCAVKGQVNPSWGLMLRMISDYFEPGPDGQPVGPGVGVERDYDDDLRFRPYSQRPVTPPGAGPGGRPGSTPAPPPVELTEARRSRFALPARPGGGYNGFPQSREHDDA